MNNEEEKEVDEEKEVYFYLGSVPVDDEFIDNLGRGGE